MILLLVGGVACGSDPAPVIPSSLPTLPETALAGYSVQTERLDAAAIAAEVVDAASLEPVLEEMLAGTERRFSSRREPEQQVIARTVRFTSAAGASAYVSWLDGHAADVLGAAPKAERVDLVGAIAYSHDPSGCCPGKEMVWWMVAWARGADALVLMVGGSQVRTDVVASLATSLDEEATRT